MNKSGRSFDARPRLARDQHKANLVLRAEIAAHAYTRRELESATRRAGHYAAHATLAQAQLNQVPAWLLWCVGAWRKVRQLAAGYVPS